MWLRKLEHLLITLLELTQITVIATTLFSNVHRWPWVTSRQSGKSNNINKSKITILQTSIVNKKRQEEGLRAKEYVIHTTADSTRRPFQSFRKIMTNRTGTSMWIMTEVRTKRLVTLISDEVNMKMWADLECFERVMYHLVVNLATKTGKLVPLFVDPKWLL